MKPNYALSLLFICLIPIFSIGQAEIIDVTFGDKGKTIVPVSTGSDFAWATAVYPDGKILLGGASHNGSDYDFAFVRLNSNGLVDNTFGANGIKTFSLGTSNDRITTVAIRADGKIVAGGYSESGSTFAYAIMRLNVDGSIDTGFGKSGFVTDLIGDTYFYCVGLALQPDNKIVVAGSVWNGSDYDLAAARFTESGSLDNTFSDDGISSKNFMGSNDYAHSLALLSDGRIVVAGQMATSNAGFMMVMRLNADGTPDNGLIPNGASTLTFSQGTSKALSVAVASDNSMWLVGSVYNGANSDIAIGKMTSAGQFDGSFGNNGTLVIPFENNDDWGQDVLIQPNGKVIIGGYTENNADDDFVLIRLNSNGTFDNTFNQNGILQYSISSLGDACYTMAFQPDGKLIAAGEAKNSEGWDFLVARFLTDLNVGVIDFLKGSEFLVYPNPVDKNSVLEYALNKEERLNLTVFNTDGKMVQKILENEKRVAGDYKQPLDILDVLPCGNYLLVFDNGFSKHTLKIMKRP
jgi:uncharacterized delta-60 repeat protein